MAEVQALLDVAAALADGQPVDWEAAERQAATATDRSLLAELRFIAAVTNDPGAREGSSTVSAPLLPMVPTARSTRAAVNNADLDHWGPLRVIEHVGGGTFGEIYRAWDSRLDREVALKVLRRKDSDDEQTSTVIQEGRLLARVRHPNVVTVYGAERIEGRVGVWMEYVHGKTLEQEIAEQGRFDIDRVIAIGRELASALSTVHRAGVIHRDVKAQNVMVDREGRLVLTDFGAGVELEESTEGDARELAGTPLCVAPEVLAGQPATPQSDIYSLGVLLYHLLTGAYPVRGRSLKEVREAHANQKRVPLQEVRPDLPRGLVDIINRALNPDSERRYPTSDAFAAELAAFTSAKREASQAAGPLVRGVWKFTAIAAVLLVAVSIGAFAVWRGGGTPTNDQSFATKARATGGGPDLPAAVDSGEASGPTFTTIEFPGATRTDLFCINDHGVIIGNYVDSNKTTHGFVLSEGNFTTIDFPGAVRTRPTGLNNDGTVVGDFDDTGGTVHGFLLRSGTFAVIDVPGATSTRAESVNSAGDVVGDYIDANSVWHGFLLSGGTFSDIDFPGAVKTRAIRLNDAGEVVGDYRDPKEVPHGFLFSKGQFTTIDVPGATVTQAFGINTHGTIVGGYGFPSRHGFLFRDGRMTPVDVPGAFQTAAVSINSSGSIVGSYLGGTPLRTRGFLLRPE